MRQEKEVWFTATYRSDSTGKTRPGDRISIPQSELVYHEFLLGWARNHAPPGFKVILIEVEATDVLSSGKHRIWTESGGWVVSIRRRIYGT